jgi:hypothetical protein
MRINIGPASHRGRRTALLAIAASAVSFVLPSVASAAPPVAAALSIGMIGQAEFGTVKGRLVWGGDQVPPIKVLEEKGKAEKDPNVCAKDQPIMSRELVVDPQTKGVSYAFAYISRPSGSNPQAIQELVSRQPTLELDQKNCEFLPYLVAMNEGQALVVKSSDPTNHNVRLNAFSNEGVNQNVGPGAELRLKLVAEKRPIKLNCDIHPWMKCYIMVFDHAFFATTATDGSFEIKGVPAGAQKLVLWQENVGYANQGGGAGMPVTVKAGEVTDVGEIKLDPAKVKPSS